MTVGGNTFEADPLFTNLAADDYTLQPTSPAINAGTTTTRTSDFAGKSIFGVDDIGAYEYQWISPTASFSSDTSQLTADFTDSSSDSDGTIATYSWDFGDSATSTSQNPSHTYGAGGDYTVQLVVTDNHGAQATTTSLLSVSQSSGGSSGSRIRSSSGTTDDTQIAELRALLETLQTQAGITSSTDCTFTRNLQLNDEGEDVRCLQLYLNQNSFVLASDGFGAPGEETTFFGLRTYHALVRFQEANSAAILAPLGLSAGTGYFGPSTRAFIAAN